VLGFSLRLGLNITRSMFSGALERPAFLTAPPGFLAWDLHNSHHCGDWGYAWELSGTVYRTDVVRDVVRNTPATSPNGLEAGGGGRWSALTSRHLMRAWTSSRLVVPTVNVVQRDFQNAFLGATALSPPFLLECWNHGLRLDDERLAAREHDCVHTPDFHLRRG
jgi:hypothetical protein